MVGGKGDLVLNLVVHFLHRSARHGSTQATWYPCSRCLADGLGQPHIFLVMLAVTFISHYSI